MYEPHRCWDGQSLAIHQRNVGKHIFRCAVGDNVPVRHDDKPVGSDAFVHMVRYQHHGHAVFAAELRYRADDLGAPLRVEHRGRLIEDDYARLHCNDARNGDALLLPAGQEVRRMHAEIVHVHLL